MEAETSSTALVAATSKELVERSVLSDQTPTTR
jgi:hypothetical protein